MNKKHLTLIVGAGLLALGVPSVCLARGEAARRSVIADVPLSDHWAYQSVDTLQEAGIVMDIPMAHVVGCMP